MEDRALRWNSDLDGDLGTGASLALQASSLTTGTHTITLTAQDSQGQVGIDTLTIQVMRYRPSFPAILAVDSLSIDFTVELGSSEPMTYSMSIRNIGDGGMNWRATVDQPWISISAASGTTPSDLILTVHPSGLPLGEHQGVVTVASSDPVENSPQSIPVTLYILNKQETETAIFLPLVQK